MMNPIVSAKWLNDNLKNPDLIILDASLKQSKSGKINKPITRRIKGARYFDIKDKFSDKSSLFPNTFPSTKQFEEACQELGINQNSQIVVYDTRGIYSSPRVWWMFKTMGHKNIAVLDGGFVDWLRKEFETEDVKNENFGKGDFLAQFQEEGIKKIDFIKDNIQRQNTLLIDARSKERFNSVVPEPRAGLRNGNIPNSINIPFQEVLDGDKFKTKEALVEVFKKYINTEKPLTFTCGSGITACILLLAIELAEIANSKSIYDGSWTEWGTMEK